MNDDERCFKAKIEASSRGEIPNMSALVDVIRNGGARVDKHGKIYPSIYMSKRDTERLCTIIDNANKEMDS